MENKEVEIIQDYPDNMPHIGADGFWYVGQTYTGVRASGSNGITPRIGVDGYWYLGDKNTEVRAAGEQGPKGESGESGLRGVQGPIGPEGAQGIQGPIGPRGIEGPMGPQGKQGIAGPEGPKGDKGESGPVNLANNLITTIGGFALDAMQGKSLDDKITAVNRNIDYDISETVRIKSTNTVAATTRDGTALQDITARNFITKQGSLNDAICKMKTLWTGRVNSGYIFCDMSQYTYIILVMDGPCSMVTITSKAATAGVPLHNGTKYIPGLRTVVYDFYQDHLWVYDIFDTDSAGNEYREGRYITGIVGVS